MNLALLQIRDIWQDILDVNKPAYVVPITHNLLTTEQIVQYDFVSIVWM